MSLSNKPDIIAEIAEILAIPISDINETQKTLILKALFNRLAAEAVELVEFGETEVLPTVPPIHDEIQHVEIIKAIPLDKLKAIMEIKEL